MRGSLFAFNYILFLYDLTFSFLLTFFRECARIIAEQALTSKEGAVYDNSIHMVCSFSFCLGVFQKPLTFSGKWNIIITSCNINCYHRRLICNNINQEGRITHPSSFFPLTFPKKQHIIKIQVRQCYVLEAIKVQTHVLKCRRLKTQTRLTKRERHSCSLAFFISLYLNAFVLYPLTH